MARNAARLLERPADAQRGRPPGYASWLEFSRLPTVWGDECTIRIATDKWKLRTVLHILEDCQPPRLEIFLPCDGICPKIMEALLIMSQ